MCFFQNHLTVSEDFFPTHIRSASSHPCGSCVCARLGSALLSAALRLALVLSRLGSALLGAALCSASLVSRLDGFRLCSGRLGSRVGAQLSALALGFWLGSSLGSLYSLLDAALVVMWCAVFWCVVLCCIPLCCIVLCYVLFGCVMFGLVVVCCESGSLEALTLSWKHKYKPIQGKHILKI